MYQRIYGAYFSYNGNMLNTSTILMRLYLRSNAVPLPLNDLIRMVTTPSDAPSAVPLWHETSRVLPYVDLQYGTRAIPRQAVAEIWQRYGDTVHTVWMRYSSPDDDVDKLQFGGPLGHQQTYRLRYRYDRVRVEWADTAGNLSGVTGQRLRHPGVYRANNSRLPVGNTPTRYGTRTSPSYGKSITLSGLNTDFNALPGVLDGEHARPSNTRRVLLYYGRHLVRVLHTVRPEKAPPYWLDFSLDDWDNLDNTPWRNYHNHYCGLE